MKISQLVKIGQTPTTLVITVFSWLIAVLSMSVSAYFIIFKAGEVKSLLVALFMFLGGLLLAALIRMFGNIGQMLFDLKGELQAINQGTREAKEASTQAIASLYQNIGDIKDVFTQVNSESWKVFLNKLEELKNIFAEINCDSEDISQNIYQIKDFFEKIEKHLKLKE